jgi:hypothetical protein
MVLSWYSLIGFWIVLGFDGVNGLISPLRSLVTYQTFVYTVLDGVVRELPESVIITSLSNMHFTPDFDFLCIGLFGLSVYFKGYRYSSLDDKWSSIEIYSNIQKFTRVLILFLIIVLTKNVENVI